MTGGTDAAGGTPTHTALTASAPGVLDGPGLPHVFSPAEAAAVLREAGLREMTECALRTRAYRKQVPFHRNGRRIAFTLGDLREIALGKPCAPNHQSEPSPAPKPPRPSHHRPASRLAVLNADPWRAKQPRDCHARPARATRAGSRKAHGTGA